MTQKVIDGDRYTEVFVKADPAQPLPVDIPNQVSVVTGLEIPEHDHIDLSYTGSNLTGVVYKSGGASGTTVATLTLAYDGSDNLTSVTKS
ncbi:MAG: hypothetical protein ACO3PY_06155 [Pontimonas sp.]